MDASSLTVAEAMLRDEAVLQFVLDAKGMHWGGLILWTGILLKEGVG